VDLGPQTHRITRKYADLALLTPAAQQRIIELIQAKGGVVVANSEPGSENMRKVRINRFVETGGGTHNDYATHLYTPIALGYPWYQLPQESRTAKRFMADVADNLRAGALYYYYGVPNTYNFGCLNRMFPFTPRELHAGWLLGEERIITTESGDYGWGDKSRATGYRYDVEGVETPLDLKPTVVKGANVYSLKLEPGEIAILVREK